MDKKLPIKIQLPDGFLDEEIRCDYIISAHMKEVWAVELDLVVELLRVCNKFHLNIYSDGGTTLGAVRHGGFIPWDDDIDLVMFRDDYEKLCLIAEKEFQHPYFFQTEYTDPGSARGHAQLRNSNTTGILTSEADFKFSFNQGIFIDIFPLDNVPQDDLTRKKYFAKIKRKRKNVNRYCSISSRYTYSRCNSIKDKVKGFLHHFSSVEKEKRKFIAFENLLKKYDTSVTDSVAKLFFDEVKSNFIWKRSWFDSIIYMKFEMIELPVPCGYEKVLDRFFGEWKTPIMADSTHSGVIFDVNTSYLDYLGRRDSK